MAYDEITTLSIQMVIASIDGKDVTMEEDTRRIRDSVVLYKKPYPSLCPAIFSR